MSARLHGPAAVAQVGDVEDWIVIVRSFRGIVVRGEETRFYEIVRRRVIDFRQAHSLVESHVSRRMTDEGDRFLITTHWPDWPTLLQWAGDDLERPWGFDEVVPCLSSWEIEHFEEIETRDRSGAGPVKDEELTA